MPSLVATLGANITPFISGLNNAKAQAGRIGGTIAGNFRSHLVGGLAGVLSVGTATMGVQRAIEFASGIKDLSMRLGMSTDAIQEWDYALRQNGSSMESAAGFFEKLAVSMETVRSGGGASKQVVADFNAFGISLDQVTSKNAKVETLARGIAAVFQSGGNQEKLIGPLRRLGGKSAGDIIPAFVDGFEDMRMAAHDLGLILNNETIGSLDLAGDAIDRLKLRTTNAFGEMAVAIDKAIVVLGSWWNTWNEAVQNNALPKWKENLKRDIAAHESQFKPSSQRSARLMLDDDLPTTQRQRSAAASRIDPAFVNQFAAIGGFGHSISGSPSVQLLDIQRKSLAQLEAVRKATEELAKRAHSVGGRGASEVTF